MTQSTWPPENPIDVAALIAGVIAVIVSAIAGDEAYNILGAGVGLTTGLVIFGYVFKRRRDRLQSLAFGSVVGGIAIPVVCFVVQMVYAGSNWRILLEHDKGGEPVNNWWAIGTWLIVGVTVFLRDRFLQSRFGKG